MHGMQFTSSVKHRLLKSIQASAEQVEDHTISIGFLGVFGFLLYYPVWTIVYPQPYENLGLRITCALICFSLMLKPSWPAALNNIFPYFWYGSILLVLPFFFTYMTIHNQYSELWVSGVIVSIYLLILLTDWLGFLLLSLVGALIAAGVCSLQGISLAVPKDVEVMLTLVPFAVLSGMVIRYWADRKNNDRLEGVLSAAGSIAHELRTPLLGMKSGIVGLQKYLPRLFEAYELAKGHGLPIKSIRKARYHTLFPVLDRINEEIDYSNTIIDMLLVNAKKQNIEPAQFTMISINECIEHALERYPFGSSKDKAKIHWKKTDGDYYFWGSKMLMEHVFFNLIKNALYYIEKADKGQVNIWLSQDDHEWHLHFKDTGKGIPSKHLPHIFNRFYSTRELGTGIGLSFCQQVIESFQGKMTCYSELDEYTEFLISFPKGVTKG